MHAIILAAGYATRMYPLTENTPKPLLPIGKKLMIDYIIERLPKDLKGIHIVTNAKFFPQFQQWAKGKNVNIVNDETSSNEARLEGIGDILFTINSQNIDDDLMIIAGDNLFEFDLNKMVDEFKAKKTPIVALSDLKDKNKLAKKFGTVEIDKNNRIIGFEEKPEHPKTTLASTACYILSKNHIATLKKYVEIIKEKKALGFFFIWLYTQEPVHCVIYQDKWHDIGSLEEYKIVNELYKKL